MKTAISFTIYCDFEQFELCNPLRLNELENWLKMMGYLYNVFNRLESNPFSCIEGIQVYCPGGTTEEIVNEINQMFHKLSEPFELPEFTPTNLLRPWKKQATVTDDFVDGEQIEVKTLDNAAELQRQRAESIKANQTSLDFYGFANPEVPATSKQGSHDAERQPKGTKKGRAKR